MEESMANAWLQDSRGLVRTKIGEVYYSGCQESESSVSLQPSHNIDEFTPSSSSTLSSETADQYSYFDPYLQIDTVACKGVTTTSSDPATSDCRSDGGSAMSQALEQLLKPTVGEPLHQLPGWAQHDYTMEEWQQNPSGKSLKPVVVVPPPTETHPLHHRLWMMETPAGLTSYNSLTPLEEIHAPFQNRLFHSAGPLPVHTNTSTEMTRKAAARKNRILVRQKSAPHQRGSTDSLGSSRGSKKTHSTKIPQEFLMCNYAQVGNLSITEPC
jgi:hypothetical protein